jgi:uncharacterized membrane protein
MLRMIMGMTAALTMGASISAANATSLDFIGDPSPGAADETCIENGTSGCYGDHASGSPNANGSTIGQGNGFTPDIGAAYSGNLRTWVNGGTSAYLGSGDNVNTGFFTITADAGFQIKLNSVTLDTDGVAGTHSVGLYSGGPGGTFLQSLDISGSDPVSFALNLVGNQFTLAMSSWDVGVTNVNFDQVASTPLPAGLLFFLTGLGGLGLAGWRRKMGAVAA